MKALTLHNPWASLLAHGFKQIETRSWKTNYRGPLAIHASARTPAYAMEAMKLPPFRKFLDEIEPQYTWGLLPTGVIVATCRLVECMPTEYVTGAKVASQQEILFGNYEAGRFAWVLSDIERLPVPIAAKGHQQLWNWEGV